MGQMSIIFGSLVGTVKLCYCLKIDENLVRGLRVLGH
jgi:hypothetical protein